VARLYQFYAVEGGKDVWQPISEVVGNRVHYFGDVLWPSIAKVFR